MRTGYIISGAAHGLVMLWLLFGGLILPDRQEPPVTVAEVSIVSSAEFAAMTAPKPVTAAPAASPAPAARPAPPQEEPAPEPVPAPLPEPPAPDAQPEPAPEPETPPKAERVTSEVVEAPADPLPEGPTLIEETAPDAAAPETPAQELPAQAPEASTTEIVTEADTPTNAPVSSPRPPARPTPPPPPAETATAAAAPAPGRDAAIDSAVDSALAGVLGEAASPVAAGPPLTRGEKDGLRVAVQRCWNVGSLSTDALRTTVVVLAKMAQNGKPESVSLVSSNGASNAATASAYEAARRAVIRCGRQGYPLPADKYEQWREIEMTFDPTNMRIK